MMANKTRRNDKNLLKTRGEYSYVIDEFGGLDAASSHGRSADSRFPYLVNMYRDREKAGGAAIETIPGYRLLPKYFGGEEERIYGLFTHVFDGVKYLLIHKGCALYAFSLDTRDEPEALAPLCSLAERESRGFSFGESFYLLDGENVVCVSSPQEARSLGDEAFTDEMKEEGLYPETDAYVPTAYRNREKAEDRNLLTDYYDVEEVLSPDGAFDNSHGLYLRPTDLGGREVLEVYGIEEGRRLAFVPEEAEYGGRVLPIAVIAPMAFSGSKIERAILSPSLERIDGIADTPFGGFGGATSLKEVYLYGACVLGPNAFAGCTALERVLLGGACAIDPTAFADCGALTSVYYVGDAEEALGGLFHSSVTLYSFAKALYGKVGDTLRIPCMADVYYRIYILSGGEYGALSDFSAYEGIFDSASGLNEGYSVRALRSAPLVEYYMKHTAGDENSHYLFVTLTEEDGLLSYRDGTVSYRIPLPDRCGSIVTVTCDGVALSSRYAAEGYYKMQSESVEGRSYVSAVRVILPPWEKGEKTVRIRCYGVNGVYGTPGVYGAFPAYGGSSFDLIRKCRYGAVYDGHIFLSGNPDLPRAVFYSVTSPDGSAVYFSPDAYFTLADDGVCDLLSHPSYLVLMLKRGGLRFVQPSGKGYGVMGGFATPKSLGKSLIFGDSCVFLTEQGVFSVGEGKVWEESRLENCSALVSVAFPKGAGAVDLALWKGYLAVMLDGEIFLADSSATFSLNGEKQYEWYRLSGIGHYGGDSPCYHHVSVDPLGEDATVEGKPLLIWGEEKPFDGEACFGICQPYGVEVAYGTVDGACYLLDTDGERVGGIFSPATCLACEDGLLLFGTADGYLACFNTDKRGVAPVVNREALPCGEDEIHRSYYSFAGHRYPSGFVTAFADMGVMHLAKRTVKKSLSLRLRTMAGSTFTVYVKCDGGGFEKLTEVVATSFFKDTDLSRFSFADEDGQVVLLYEGKRRWVDKQYLLLSEGFEAPFAIDGIAYRYTVDGKPKV